MPFDSSRFRSSHTPFSMSHGATQAAAFSQTLRNRSMLPPGQPPGLPPNNPPQGGDNGPPNGSGDPNQDVNNQQSQTQGGGQNLQYPPDLGDYYLQLNFMKYHRPSPGSNASSEATGTVTLPLPDNLGEAFNISYEDKALGFLGNVFDNLARSPGFKPTRDGIKAGVQDAFKQTSKQLSASGYEASIRAVDDNTNFVSGLFNSHVGSKLDTTTLTGLVEQFVGASPNPSMAVLFGGVGFRRHQFEWVLAPKNQTESDSIKAILNFIRQRSLPAFSQGVTNILDYPDMLLPKLYPWATNDSRTSDSGSVVDSSVFTDTYMYGYKKCVIDAIGFNPNPNGMLSVFGLSKAPQFVKLTLSLREIEYFTSDDFGGSGSDLGGNLGGNTQNQGNTSG